MVLSRYRSTSSTHLVDLRAYGAIFFLSQGAPRKSVQRGPEGGVGVEHSLG
jgi:hypothetical protein